MESSTTGLARGSDEELDRNGLVLTAAPEGEDAKRLKRREVERRLSKGNVTGGSMSLGLLVAVRFGGLRIMRLSVIDLSLSEGEAEGSNTAPLNLSVFAQKANEECGVLEGLLEEVRRERSRELGGRNGGTIKGPVLAMMEDMVGEAQMVLQKEAAREDGRSEVDKAHQKLLGILSDLGLGTDAANLTSCTPPPEVEPVSRFEGSELENVHKLGTYTVKRWSHWFHDEMARGVFETGLRKLGVAKQEGIESEDGKVVEGAVGDDEVLKKGDEGTEIDELNPSQYQPLVEVVSEDDDVDQLGPSQYVVGERSDMVVEMGDVESETGSGKVGSGEVVEKEVDETGDILVGSSGQGGVVDEEFDELRPSQYDVQSGDVDAGKTCAVERTEDVRREEEFEDVDQLRPSQYEDGAGLTETQEFEDVDQLRPSQYENGAGLTEAQGVVTGTGQDEERMEGSSKRKEISVRDVCFVAFI